MTRIKKGDFILHSKQSKIVAISLALSDYHEDNQPENLQDSPSSTQWNQKGYKVNTDYAEFDIPFDLKDHRTWLMTHFTKDSPFTKLGKGKQQYMCNLSNSQAIYLIEKSIDLQTNKKVLSYLKDALSDVVGELEYSLVEKETINEALDNDNDQEEVIQWNSKPEKQAMTLSAHTGKAIPKRDPQRAINALRHANYKCEFNETDKTFLRKSGKPYTEPHHLIPISKYYEFNYSIDIPENIISLCSHCHNLLHYGRFEDKEPLLRKLYEARKNALKSAGIDLTWEQLESYYK